METTNFGFVASLLFVGVPTIFLIGLFISTQDGVEINKPIRNIVGTPTNKRLATNPKLVVSI